MTDLAVKTNQLGRSCRHYTPLGVVNRSVSACKIGHPILEIVKKATNDAPGTFFKLPCRPGPEKAATCPDYDPKTDAEREADRKATSEHMDRVVKMLGKAARWKKLMVDKNKSRARANCPCCGGKGTVSLSCAIGYNNHLRAKCSLCEVGFIE